MFTEHRLLAVFLRTLQTDEFAAVLAEIASSSLLAELATHRWARGLAVQHILKLGHPEVPAESLDALVRQEDVLAAGWAGEGDLFCPEGGVDFDVAAEAQLAKGM